MQNGTTKYDEMICYITRERLQALFPYDFLCRHVDMMIHFYIYVCIFLYVYISICQCFYVFVLEYRFLGIRNLSHFHDVTQTHLDRTAPLHTRRGVVFCKVIC